MAVPVMQFNPYNPLDTAIQTALGTYKGIGEGRKAQMEAQTYGKKLPFIEQEALAGINLHNAQAQQAQQEANFKRAIYEAISGGDIFGDGGGAPMPAPMGQPNQGQPQPSFGGGQGMGGAPGPMAQPVQQPQPGGFPGGGYTGPSGRTAMIRKASGFPEVTPGEQYAIDLNKHAQQQRITNQINAASPTTETVGRHQRLIEVAPSLPESIFELINDYDKAPGSPLLTALGESIDIHYPSQFNKKVTNAAEATALAKNFGTGPEGIAKAESILKPAPNESKEEFSGRMYKLISDAMPSIQAAYRDRGQEVPSSFYDGLEKVRQASIPTVKMRAPDGKIRLVPKDQVSAAEKAGGKRV